jgi:parvulin-like peptidyl-prolyl isomerase
MRRLVVLSLAVLAAAALVCGCGKPESKVIVRITDNEGKLEPRTVTVGYVNERLDRMMPPYIPNIPGDEGKKRLLEDVIRKELLVVQALRAGLDKDPQMEEARAFHEQQKAEMMLRAEFIEKPGEVTQQEVEEYYAVREASFQLNEIAVATKEEAEAVRKRVTEGGEDFGRVAQSVSLAATAAEGGRQQAMEWFRMHPLVRVLVQNLDTGDVSEPLFLGNWTIYQVGSRKPPASQQPLEGQHLVGITSEARAFKTGITENRVYEQWMSEADIQFDQKALELAAQRTAEAVKRAIPDMGEPADVETRMQRAAVLVVPEFTEEEKGTTLVTYRIGGKATTVTLGGYQEIIQNTPGMETPKESDPFSIERLMKSRVHGEILAYWIEKKGYRNSDEMKQYLAERAEETMVRRLYDAEVVKKVADPLPVEVREYFESHSGEYVEPPRVDVQHVIVPTEQMANELRQRLLAGQTTLDAAAETYSISGWLKANKGIVRDYYQGEGRFGYLQELAFTLEPGVLSEPITAPGGFAIVKVLKKYPARPLTFEEAGEAATQALIGLRREERLTQLLDEIRASVVVETLDENLQYVRDTAEVYREKTGQTTEQPEAAE